MVIEDKLSLDVHMLSHDCIIASSTIIFFIALFCYLCMCFGFFAVSYSWNLCLTLITFLFFPQVKWLHFIFGNVPNMIKPIHGYSASCRSKDYAYW